MAKNVLYRGFSTANALTTRTLLTADVETVKRDLLNHIYTIPGERVMQPTFGTRIPLMAFEPLDDVAVKTIEEDLRKVFEYDPRVQLLELAVVPLPDNNAIVAFADLLYVQLGTKETMKLEFAAKG